MKPEHFIYKSDGLYYMQNVPNKPGRFFTYYQANGKTAETGQYAWKIYNEALERAKVEAVLVTDPYVYQIAMHRYFPHFIDYSKTPQDNFAMCASIGQVYLLNIEEEIEVVCEGRCKGIKCTIGKVCDGDSSHNCLDKVARIAAPKKEEESEEQIWYQIFELHAGVWYQDRDYVINEVKRHFEIKRKPL